MQEARAVWQERLLERGVYDATLDVAEGQPYLLRALGPHLRVAGDTDHRLYGSDKYNLNTGVSVLLGEKAPRVPSVFERKSKWCTYDSDDEDRGTAKIIRPSMAWRPFCRGSLRRRLVSR